MTAQNDAVNARVQKLREDAQAGGYTLNPDDGVVRALAEGLLRNRERYGIESCPCRLFRGSAADNADIICPCNYRDDDLAEYGACFCGLYVADASKTQAMQVPERRPPLSERQRKAQTQQAAKPAGELTYPVYRCSVCGYLCARDNPPQVCPICKAGRERFERFL